MVLFLQNPGSPNKDLRRKTFSLIPSLYFLYTEVVPPVFGPERVPSDILGQPQGPAPVALYLKRDFISGEGLMPRPCIVCFLYAGYTEADTCVSARSNAYKKVGHIIKPGHPYGVWERRWRLVGEGGVIHGLPPCVTCYPLFFYGDSLPEFSVPFPAFQQRPKQSPAMLLFEHQRKIP